MTRAFRTVLFGLTLIVGAACIGLAGWQARRLLDRRAANTRARTGLALPASLLVNQLPTGTMTYRRVRAIGRYDQAHEFVIRGRLLLEVPGVQIVTPFRLAGNDTAILVNRGFVPAPDGTRPVPGFDEPDPDTLVAVTFPMPDAGDGQPISSHQQETWRRLDWTAMRARLPYPVATFYMIAAHDSLSGKRPGSRNPYPIRLEPPPLDNGPHLSYAIQWLLIGGAVLGFGFGFVRRESPTSRIDVPG